MVCKKKNTLRVFHILNCFNPKADQNNKLGKAISSINKIWKKHSKISILPIFLVISIFSSDIVHANESNKNQEDFGAECIKEASIEALESFACISCAIELAATGNICSSIALWILEANHANKAVDHANEAWNFYNDKPEPTYNFEPDILSFLRD